MASDWATWIRSGDWARDEEATIPVLPSHVGELIHMANDPDVPTHRIAAIIARDPVLAMQVMNMANSAWMAPAVRITNIHDAVFLLGTATVRNVVMAACINAQMADPKIYGTQGRQVVDHCVGTAFLASLLAQPFGSSGELFLGGLLHDIGKLLLLKLARDYTLHRGVGPTAQERDAVIAERHAHCGGWLAGRWKMPTSVSEPIEWHHEPDWAAVRMPVLVVYAANRLAHRYGLGCEPDPADLLADPIFEEIGIDATQLGRLDSAAADVQLNTRSLTRAA